MRVHAVCHYRSKSDTWTDKWTNSDFTARNIVAGLKGRPFNGFAMIKRTTGGEVRLDDTVRGRGIALSFAAQYVARKLKEAGYETADLIPVPASNHTVPGSEFTGSKLAEAIQRLNAAYRARPILYFDSVQPKSATGGGRNWREIERHLVATPGISAIERPVLIDDVFTTGAHFRAAAHFLAKHGLTVEDGFTVGRTAWTRPENMFSVPSEVLVGY